MNKVLIIDDDKELCALMKKCIEQEKLSAVTVYNGIEGVRLIDENKDSYSLIILDVMLPDIDGFQILQKIRDTSNIPVLMLTAKSSEEDKVFGLRLGADDYLTKPFGINELLARVNSLIRRYTTLNPFTADIGIAEVRDFIKTLSIERGKTILISSHILSEIALLADDIGIIDHGVLLEENSMNELQKKNSKYILLQVSDIPKTSLVLERQFGVTEYSVQDEHTLRIYDTSLDMAAVNKALVVQDIAVISSQLCNDTLEDYFKKITGGEGIA